MKNHFKSSFDIFTLFALLASLLGSAVFVTPVHAAGIVVNSNADTIADDGTCTLREAITNANGDSQLYTSAGECAMGAGTDTITFGGNYTITLNGSQLPAVTSTIVINGNGSANTIIEASTCDPVNLPSGCTPAEYRVFEVSNTGDLTLGSLTVRHGRCNGLCVTDGTVGGGIYNSGTLMVRNSTFSNNSTSIGGGGIYNGSGLVVEDSTFLSNVTGVYGGGIYSFNQFANVTLTVKNCLFSDNSANAGEGGGIFNGGPFTLINSTFSNNHSFGNGGGISNFGNLTVANSTFSDNSAGIRGGGIDNVDTLTIRDSSFSNNVANYGYGGGVANNGGHALSVANSTFTSNSARDGGGIANYGITTAVNSTFLNNFAYNNGGGITNNAVGSTLTVTNNTLLENSATQGGGIYSDSFNSGTTIINTIVANSVNGGDCNGPISGDNYNLATDNTCDSATQTSFAEINLGPLANNGGPTQTLALIPMSSAIDTGNNTACPATDQRGVSRPKSVACDIGSFEAIPIFSDVLFNHWANRYIEHLYNAGITGGCSTSPLMYCPDATVTRAQMAIFILRGIHGSAYTPPAATGTVFADVPVGSFAADWIEQLAAEGVTSGCGGGNYCPDATVTRAQMAIFLLRGEHGSTYAPPAATGTVFGDVPLSSFAADWIEQFAAEGITSGCGGGNYCPENSVTRAEMAVFLVRAFGLP